MKKKSGIIYDLGNKRYGLAIYSEQDKSFIELKKVYLHVFTDRLCTVPELDPKNGKEIVTLKSRSLIKKIGYAD